MAKQPNYPPQSGQTTYPVGREAALHSEATIYHPTGEAHPEVDRAVSAVPSAKKYLLWLLIAVLIIVGALYLVLR